MGVIAKQSIRGTIVTYAGVAVGFVTTFFVITRYLSAEEIGLARVLIDAATLYIGLAQLGTSASILRFYPYFVDSPTSAEAERNEHGFFFWTLLIPLLGFIIVGALFVACHAPLSRWFSEKSPLFVEYYYCVLPLAFAMLYQTVFETNANVRLHIVVPRAVRELLVRIGLLGVYVLYAFRILSIDGFVLALIGVYLLAALCNAAYLLSLGNIQWKPDMAFLKQHPALVKKYLLYTGFLVVSAVASVLAPTLSSFFITAEMGLNYTGIFAIATYIAVMVSIPYRSLTAIASPQLSMHMKDGSTKAAAGLIGQVSGNLLLIGGLILAFIWINIDLLFAILPNGTTYAVARTCVLLLGIGQLLVATFQFALTALNYSKWYALSLLYSFILTALALVLNNLLIPRYGMNGAAMASLIAQAIYFVLIVVTIRIALSSSIFTSGHLKTLLLLAAVFALNALLTLILPVTNIWLSSAIRSLLAVGAAVVAYYWHICPEINSHIDAFIHSIRL